MRHDPIPPLLSWGNPAIEYFAKRDLLSALDSLSKLGLGSGDSDIAVGLEWFFKAQQPTGQWKLKILNSGADRDTHLWIDLAICRLIKRFDA